MNETEQTPVSTAGNASSVGLKDLLIPISIAIAGAFIGLGLYMSGGAAPTTVTGGQDAPTQQQPEGDTDAIAEVTEDDWIKGDINAPVTIVEFSDFDCPFCSRFHDTMNDIVEDSNGQVAWVYRHFPLAQLHPQAAAVAVAAECVGAQGGNDAFWQFTDAYFAARGAGDQTAHGVLIPQLVTETGVNQATFTECFENGEYQDKVQAQLENAVETGGRGTPWSILIGPDGTTYPINGAQPRAAVEQIINLALESA